MTKLTFRSETGCEICIYAILCVFGILDYVDISIGLCVLIQSSNAQYITNQYDPDWTPDL